MAPVKLDLFLDHRTLVLWYYNMWMLTHYNNFRNMTVNIQSLTKSGCKLSIKSWEGPWTPIEYIGWCPTTMQYVASQFPSSKLTQNWPIFRDIKTRPKMHGPELLSILSPDLVQPFVLLCEIVISFIIWKFLNFFCSSCYHCINHENLHW